MRRQVARRATIVQHRTRLKNRVHAILHRCGTWHTGRTGSLADPRPPAEVAV
jgi:transposase